MVDGISWDELLEQAGDTISDTYEPLPADTYDFEVVEATHTITKSGAPRDMWKVQAKVTGDGKYKNRRLFTNILLDKTVEDGAKWFFQKMGALGLNVEYFKTNPSNDAISNSLKGRTFRGVVVQKTWQGEVQNDIKKLLPPTTGTTNTAPPAPAPSASAPAAPPAPPAPAPAAPQETHAAPPAAPAPPAPAPAAPATEAGQVPPPPPLGNLPF